MSTTSRQAPDDVATATTTDSVDGLPAPDPEHVQTPLPDLTDLFDVLFRADDTGAPDVGSDDAVGLAVPLALLDSSPDRFPGRQVFRLGTSDPAVTRLGTMLVARGGARFYSSGPGPRFGVADRNACAAFQRAQGWTGANADGYPGPRTWELLVTGRGKDIRAGSRTVKSPVPGYRASYRFGIRNRRYAAGFHTGCDYAAPKGSVIVAVAAGTVIRTDWGGAYGNWTHVRDAGGHVWMYAHQSRRTVRKGQRVAVGEVIGYVGTTGNVTGPHLHLEKSRRGSWSYAKVVEPTW